MLFSASCYWGFAWAVLWVMPQAQEQFQRRGSLAPAHSSSPRSNHGLDSIPSSQGSPNSWLPCVFSGILFHRKYIFISLRPLWLLCGLFGIFFSKLKWFEYFLLPLLLHVSLLPKLVNINLSMISRLSAKRPIECDFFYYTAGHCSSRQFTLLECYLKLCEMF